MQVVLLVIQLMIAVALIAVILIQRSAQDGGGLMGGGSTMGGLFTARGSANLLTRTTAVLATLFIVNSLALGYIASRAHQTHSIVDQLAPQSQAPAAPVNTAPATPEPAPAPVPAAPAVPQVPMSQ